MLSAFTPALARDHCTTDPSAGSCLQVGANRSLLLNRRACRSFISISDSPLVRSLQVAPRMRFVATNGPC
jgi:hypothetical protein